MGQFFLNNINWCYSENGEFLKLFVYDSTKTMIRVIEDDRILPIGLTKDKDDLYQLSIRKISDAFKIDEDTLNIRTTESMIFKYTDRYKVKGSVFVPYRAKLEMRLLRNKDANMHDYLEYLNSFCTSQRAGFSDLKPLINQVKESIMKEYSAQEDKELN